ncbi:MAG TPA: hypothetical protein PKE30_07615 [Niabella sp.]|nr:hypothetical protein [Niabella sp.]
MKTISTTGTTICCGAYSKKIKEVKGKLPPNPKIEKGVALIYLGAGFETFTGKFSGHKYYVSDHQRHFKVAPDDVTDLLHNKEIILRP